MTEELDFMKEEINFRYEEGSFDKAKKSLEQKGYEIASLSDSVKVRLQASLAPFFGLIRKGNWVRESAIYVPRKGIYISQYSPIMKNARKAVSTQRQGKNLYLSSKQTEKALENAVKIPYERNIIPTNKLGEDELTAHLFGDFAKDYGHYLKMLNIGNMPLVFDHPKSKPYATQIFFWNPDHLSCISGANRLYDGLPVLGIKQGAQSNDSKT